MKIQTLLSILAFTVTSLVLKASGPEEKELLKVSLKSSGIVDLTYASSGECSPRITILDSKREIIFTERLNGKKGILRKYDITAFPEGEYYFEVLENKVKHAKTILYKREFLNDDQNFKVEITPTEIQGKYNLTCKGATNKPIYISIYSKDTGVIFEDYISSKKDFSRIYDLSKLKNDVYIFEISNNNNIVSKEVNSNISQLSLNK